MNIADIEKIANRKRFNADAEKLREAVKRETTNIIKLKVAQDTAYWDLQEKLHQLENNHERLQQNMVEVQMQHEVISGQYQDELRLRPETVNKLSSTREICDVLEEYSERLKASVSRSKADQATLAEAYNKSGQLVRDIKDHHIKSDEKYLQIVTSLEEKVKLLTDHKEQMTLVYTSSKQHLDSELSDARLKLATALAQKDELFLALNNLSRKVDHCNRELEKKDENIATLQRDMKKQIDEFNNQTTQIKNLNSKQEKELKECIEAKETLKKALQNQEQFTKSICDQNNQLQEKISGLEEELILRSDKVDDLETKLEEFKSQHAKLTEDIEALNKKIKDLENKINEKKMVLDQMVFERQHLKDQISAMEHQKSEIIAELNKATQESELKSIKIEELTTIIQELQMKISKMETNLENNKIDNINKINETNAILETKIKIIEVKDRELDCKASTINQLMSDLKNGTDARTKLENSIEKMKKEIEIEKKTTKEKESASTKKIEQLEIAAKERENELSKQMSIILNIRNEKERLQERLTVMQNTIGNIEKEVTGRSASQVPARQIADFDDNAVMMPSSALHEDVVIPPPKKIQKMSEFALPKEQAKLDKRAKQLDSMLFDLLSDSSMESELSLNTSEINRHFDAIKRGEKISPLHFKRRNSRFHAKGLKPAVPLSLSPIKAVKPKRTIFKTKRSDNRSNMENSGTNM